MAEIATRINSSLEKWLKKRLPQSREITLNQQRIFIVPSKLALGMLMLLLLLFILAINFQNSLVYAVCFWLMAMLVINILHTYRNLSGLTLRGIGTEPCFAGETMQLELELACLPKQKKFAIDVGWPEQDLQRINLSEQNNLRIKLSHPAPQRGYFTPPRLMVRSLYPTGLAVAWSYVTLDLSAIIYPAPVTQAQDNRHQQNVDPNNAGTPLENGHNDFGGIRDYQPGDNLRRIHWSKYAQTGELYSKTFIDQQSTELWLDWHSLSFPGLEARLSHLCSRVLECHEQQLSYGLRLPGNVIEPGSGDVHRTQCLQALALYGITE